MKVIYLYFILKIVISSKLKARMKIKSKSKLDLEEYLM